MCKKHGEIGKGDWENSRWCEACNHYHGILYNCEHYPSHIRKEIKLQSDTFKANLQNPEWIKKQIKNGIPYEAILIFKAFADIDT